MLRPASGGGIWLLCLQIKATRNTAVGEQGGRGGGRCLRARLAPLAARRASVASTWMQTTPDQCAPSNCVAGTNFARSPVVVGGRRFVQPAERPSTGVAAQKGRERPRLCIANAAPGALGGVAHAPRCQCRCRVGRREKLTAFWRGFELRSGPTFPAEVVRHCAFEATHVSRQIVLSPSPDSVPPL